MLMNSVLEIAWHWLLLVSKYGFQFCVVLNSVKEKDLQFHVGLFN